MRRRIHSGSAAVGKTRKKPFWGSMSIARASKYARNVWLIALYVARGKRLFLWTAL